MPQRRDLPSRSRHLRVNIGYIIDAEEAGEIHVRYIPTADQVADFLTAAEDRERFIRNRTIALGGVQSIGRLLFVT
jgi:hypothetical protein